MLRGLGAFSRPLGVWRLATPTPRAPGSRLQFIELQILAIERTPRGVFLVFLFFGGGGGLGSGGREDKFQWGFLSSQKDLARKGNTFAQT